MAQRMNPPMMHRMPPPIQQRMQPQMNPQFIQQMDPSMQQMDSSIPHQIPLQQNIPSNMQQKPNSPTKNTEQQVEESSLPDYMYAQKYTEGEKLHPKPYFYDPEQQLEQSQTNKDEKIPEFPKNK